VVDPRFTRSAAVADIYAPIRAGSDIAFLAGVINYMLATRQDPPWITPSSTPTRTFLIKPDFKYDNGFFSGYDEAKRNYDKASHGVTRWARTAT
jgi:formate dehydrogenase major subunit